MSNDSESPRIVARVAAFELVTVAVVSAAAVSVAGDVATGFVSSTRDLGP